jgi:hypothetical protein
MVNLKVLYKIVLSFSESPAETFVIEKDVFLLNIFS